MSCAFLTWRLFEIVSCWRVLLDALLDLHNSLVLLEEQVIVRRKVSSSHFVHEQVSIRELVAQAPLTALGVQVDQVVNLIGSIVRVLLEERLQIDSLFKKEYN